MTSLQPTGPKRSYDQSGNSQPSKRQKTEKVDLFATLPVEIFLQHVLPKLHVKELLVVGQTSRKNYAIANHRWSELRKQAHFTVDWACCKGHASNYFLTQNVISYIKSLKTCLARLDEKKLKKFKPVCDKVPAFNALVNLTRLQNGEEISSDLDASLRQEKVLDAILDIYQFAHTIYPLIRVNANAAKIAQKQRVIKKFEEEAKPKIEKLIQEGATYLSQLTQHIFSRYYLIHGKGNEQNIQFAIKLAVDISIKAKDAGDDSTWKEWKNLYVNLSDHVTDNSCLENDFEVLRNKLIVLQGLRSWSHSPNVNFTLPIVLSFFKDKNVDQQSFKEQKIVCEKLGNYPDRISSDPKLLYVLFQSYITSQNWVEADRLSPKIINKEIINKSESITLLMFQWIAAKIKVKLNKLNEAVQIYELILSQNKFNQTFSRFECLVEIFSLKFQLLDWVGADDIIYKITEAEEKIGINLLYDIRDFPISNMLYQQFIFVKRQLSKDKEAKELEIINFLEHLDPNGDITPMEALENLFQTTTPQFLSLLSTKQLINLTIVCFNQNKYERADYFIIKLKLRGGFNRGGVHVCSLSELKLFLAIKNELKKGLEAEELQTIIAQWERELPMLGI